MQFVLGLNDCLVAGSAQIRVLEVMSNSVRLGISDPSAIPTYREEVLVIRSDDDEPDDDNEFDFHFESFEIQEPSPFAIPCV